MHWAYEKTLVCLYMAEEIAQENTFLILYFLGGVKWMNSSPKIQSLVKDNCPLWFMAKSPSFESEETHLSKQNFRCSYIKWLLFD